MLMEVLGLRPGINWLTASRTVRAEAAATKRESLQFLIREKFG